MSRMVWAIVLLSFACFVAAVAAQPPGDEPRPQPSRGAGQPGGGGPRFMGGPMAQERKVVKQFDKDGDGKLNREERQAARAFLKKEGGNQRGGFGPPGMGPGGPGGMGPPGMVPGMGGPPGGGRGGPPGMGSREPGKPGPKVTPEQVKPSGSKDPFDTNVLRTLFLEFEDKDWEAELADFYKTDVEVPATLTVDGMKYPGVGVHFRGASSYFSVPAGSKRSLNVSLDFTDEKQDLFGVRTLNLLNANGDPTLMSTVLYSDLAREHLAAPRANFAKVVINGESWGVYVSVEQFNKDFLKANFNTTKGARWKVKGNPGGGGGLDYLGDKIDDYRRRYEIKTKDDDKDWKKLIELCRVLDQTPPAELEAKLRTMLDVDGLLWFLAYDIVLLNSDGYWIRASDYSLFLDEKGIFHVIPHDMNEAFRPAMGPGMGGGPPGMRGPGGGPLGMGRGPEGGPEGERPRGTTPASSRPGGNQPGQGRPPEGGRGGAMNSKPLELDPLHGLTDAKKPLRSKVLAVPKLREQYLRNVAAVAEQLDWKTLGPRVAHYRKLLDREVAADTRKLDSYESFKSTTANEAPAVGGTGRRPSLSLRAFADGRRAYLLNLPAVKEARSGASLKEGGRAASP